jgi:hypothetical protein
MRIRILHDVILLKDHHIQEVHSDSALNELDLIEQEAMNAQRNRMGSVESMNSTVSSAQIPTTDYYDSRPVSPNFIHSTETMVDQPLTNSMRETAPVHTLRATPQEDKGQIIEEYVSDDDDEQPLGITYDRQSVFTVSDYLLEDQSQMEEALDLERLEELRRKGTGNENENLERDLPEIPDRYSVMNNIEAIPVPELKKLQLVTDDRVSEQPPMILSPVHRSPLDNSFLQLKPSDFEPVKQRRRTSVVELLTNSLQRRFSKRASIEMPNLEDVTMQGTLLTKDGLVFSKKWCALKERTLYVLKSKNVHYSN